jgi:hypothetical protein
MCDSHKLGLLWAKISLFTAQHAILSDTLKNPLHVAGLNQVHGGPNIWKPIKHLQEARALHHTSL